MGVKSAMARGLSSGLQPGLVLLNTTSFSAVSSFSLPTNTFTSTYSNYKLLVTLDSKSASGNLNLRFRVAGTDNTTNNYWSSQGGINNSGVYANGTGSNPGTAATFTATWNTTGGFIDLGIYRVGYSAKPSFQGFHQQSFGTVQQYVGGILDDTIVADSLTITSSAGTITGSYSVYGYNK
jgi:hypothetical protein